jgi:hypothetical protein
VVLEPRIEVEYITAALELTARGLGDTVAPRSVVAGSRYARRLELVSLDPPLYDTFAFIQRRDAHLSPATREFLAVAEKHVQALRRRLEAPTPPSDSIRSWPTITRPSPRRSTSRPSSGCRRPDFP